MLGSQRSPVGFQLFDINYADLVQSRLLGHGRFGRVYEYKCNGTTVAIKDIAICTEDQNRFKKLLRESEILKKLNQKNIITLHDTQVKPQNLLLVMELAAGGSVSGALVQYGSLAPNVVTNWAAQIAEGMCYLHENNVVHRDLKSSNVLVFEPMDSCLIGKTLKIADFGLACDEYDITRTMSEPAGTIFWMAPEVRQAPHRFSKASDVWSYGVVVWSMFKGKEPSTIIYPVSATTNEFGSFYAKMLNDCWNDQLKNRPSFNWIVKYMQENRGNTVCGGTTVGTLDANDCPSPRDLCRNFSPDDREFGKSLASYGPIATENEKQKLLDQQQLKQWLLAKLRRKVELLQSEIQLKTNQLDCEEHHDATGIRDLTRMLARARPQLVRQLDATSIECIVDELIAAREGQGLITDEERQLIKAEKTSQGKARLLLDAVSTRGAEAIRTLAATLSFSDCARDDLAKLFHQKPVIL